MLSIVRAVKLNRALLSTSIILLLQATPKVYLCKINIEKTRLIFMAVNTFGHKKINTPKIKARSFIE